LISKRRTSAARALDAIGKTRERESQPDSKRKARHACAARRHEENITFAKQSNINAGHRFNARNLFHPYEAVHEATGESKCLQGFTLILVLDQEVAARRSKACRKTAMNDRGNRVIAIARPIGADAQPVSNKEKQVTCTRCTALLGQLLRPLLRHFARPGIR
jgi:hypothetical protein